MIRDRLGIFIANVSIVLTFVGGGTSAMAFSCWGAENAANSPLFSLEEKDVPMAHVLEKISAATGYEITVDQEWADLPVTAKLRDLTLEEGLKRLLKGMNYALVIDDKEKRISIKIQDTAQNTMLIKHEQRGETNQRDPVRRVKEDPQDLEVIPPEGPGELGITERELEVVQAQREEVDPLDLEVIPPDHPGERGITQRELDELESQREDIDPKGLEVIPPERPGERGLTERELDALEAEREIVDPKDLEVIPPEHPGERGITERELEAQEAGQAATSARE